MKKAIMYFVIVLLVVFLAALPVNAGGGCRGDRINYGHHHGNFGNDLATAAVLGAAAGAASALIGGLLGGDSYHNAPPRNYYYESACFERCIPNGRRSVSCKTYCR